MAYLRKIEELTLYTLQQQDEIDGLRQLERENQELSERVAQLEQLVSNLVPVPQGR
jgi:cell division protein FtsB